ncbi:MAG: hypothetical protein WA990_17015 [Rubrobacteraceae bacterium]
MDTLGVSRGLIWTGIALIGLTGLIHLIDAPEYFDMATYLGLSFVLNALGAALAAYGIYQGRSWGWALGIAVAGGAFVAYIVSRTVGLPGLAETAFFETLGILSLLVEALFTGLAAYILSGNSRRSTAPSGTGESSPSTPR